MNPYRTSENQNENTEEEPAHLNNYKKDLCDISVRFIFDGLPQVDVKFLGDKEPPVPYGLRFFTTDTPLYLFSVYEKLFALLDNAKALGFIKLDNNYNAINRLIRFEIMNEFKYSVNFNYINRSRYCDCTECRRVGSFNKGR